MTGLLYPLFPVASFLAFVLVLLPLPWHLEAWNSGTCYYMMWTALACLNQFVNSVIWANDAIDRAPVFCDISTRITLAASAGIPAASMCIIRRLYNISKIQAVATTHAEKRRVVLVDTLICVLFPILCLPLAYVVQGHRFDVIQEVGCHASVVNTLLSYFLVTMWPILFGLISFVYCVLTMRSFLQRQAQFAEFLSSNKALSASRYFRLMALACIEIMCTIPISIVFTVLNLKAEPFEPWVSWEDTHSNFSRVVLIPSVIWRQTKLVEVSIECGRWSPLFCALLFFAFFGFAEESRKNYKYGVTALLTACRLGKKDDGSSSTKATISSKYVQLPLCCYP
ncbi:fungal pheromone STE3G-protein-coupled receptor [Thelephora terrestris]|uniref:Fungal pheromone STE3G-protein-coupled receptor n=1 Tax=Thelephora terrestris TaxID=56493 RepID=A0A9P6HKT2_9AGAM|nr:fungal pheromone STE3G-protein-coupled receptor [Thelephora terrestris]